MFYQFELWRRRKWPSLSTIATKRGSIKERVCPAGSEAYGAGQGNRCKRKEELEKIGRRRNGEELRATNTLGVMDREAVDWDEMAMRFSP
tara:strand:+ start:982 stop:1251 length:270 start_codon:yes stop_codon:yes gene_type:complete